MKRASFTGFCLVAVLAIGCAAPAAASAMAVNRWPTAGEVCFEAFGIEICVRWQDQILAASSSANRIEGANVLTEVELVKGRGAGEGVKCHSAEAKEGVVETEPVVEELGFISQERGEVGLEERPREGELLSRFTCGEHTIELKGAVIGSITPIDKPVTPEEHFTVGVAPNKEGKQAITHFEGGPTTVLSAQIDESGFHEAALEDPGEIFPAETAEIKTEPSLEF